MADFEAALKETRASVTEEMLTDYARIQETLKSDAVKPVGGIGFVLPGMLRPRGPAKSGSGWRRAARDPIAAGRAAAPRRQ